MAKAYRVTINVSKYIPFLKRKGPILSPVAITDQVYDNLKKMGFALTVHSIIDDNEVTHHISPSLEIQEPLTEKVETTIDVKVDESPIIIDEAISSEPVISEDMVETTNDEELELEVFDKKIYEGMSKNELVQYLNKIKEVLPKELQPFNTKSKTELLKIVEEHLTAE